MPSGTYPVAGSETPSFTMLMTLVASADSAMALRRSRFWPSVLSVMFMPMKYTARFGHFLADHSPDFTLGLASAAATWPGGTSE